MVEQIYLLTDYKNLFGSKYTAIPYRSGYDKNLLIRLFHDAGYEVIFLNPSTDKIDYAVLRNKNILYTSQEDNNLIYKNFLEDIVFSLELSGASVIPSCKLLRAHENKVFFEMLRKLSGESLINNFSSAWYGTMEDFLTNADKLNYPVVIKTHYGSMSRGVYLAKTKNEAVKMVSKITETKNSFLKLWDNIRYIRHKQYSRESWHRCKFIIQEYVPGLLNDYKVLIYGRNYYVLKRENRKNDFRASGQGQLSFVKVLPEGLLDFTEKCFTLFNSPHASFDIGFNGKEFFLFEAQFVYFGTYTIEFSDFCFKKVNGEWTVIEGKSILEEVYVKSIVDFISK